MMWLLIETLRCIGLWEDDRDDPSKLDNLNLGIEISGGRMSVFIPANTNFPIKKEIIYSLGDYQSAVSIPIYEGSSSSTEDNFQLGVLLLDGILPAPNGVAKIKICFEIDANGTLNVSAQDMISYYTTMITIKNHPSRCSKMRNAKNGLKKYANNIKQTVNHNRNNWRLKEVEKHKIIEKANEAIEWLSKNPSAKLYEYMDKKKELEGLWIPIVTRLYEEASAVRVLTTFPKKVDPKTFLPPPKASSRLDEVD